MKRVRSTDIILPLHPKTCRELPEDITRMKKLFEKDPESLHRLQDLNSLEDSDDKIYPLHEACKRLHLNCVKFLIKAGAKVDFESSDINNALHYTIFGHDDTNNPKLYQIVEELLKNKKPNTNIYKFETLFQNDLMEIINLNLNYIIKLFLEYNEYFDNMLPENDFPKLYKTSFSPVTSALLAKNFDGAKLLILHGKKINNYIRRSNQFFGMPTAILKIHKNYDTALRALKIFHSFHGNLWTNHMHRDRIARNPLEFLRDQPTILEYYQGLDHVLENMMSNPLSLKDHARLSLWNYSGKNYWKLVKSINDVPKEIKEFLNLEDL